MNKLSQVLSTRPATLTITSRLDARTLASLALFWQEKGEPVRSVSELARLSLEAFSELLILNKAAEFVQTQEDANEILSRLNLSVQKTNRGNLVRAYNLENLNIGSTEVAPNPSFSHSRRTSESPVSSNSPDMIQAMALLEQGMEGDLQNRILQAKERTQEFKDSMNPNNVKE